MFKIGQRLKLCSEDHPFCRVKIGDYATYKGGVEFLFDHKEHTQCCSNTEKWDKIFTKEESMPEFKVGDRTKSKDDPSRHKAVVTGLTGDPKCPYIIKCSCGYEGKDSLGKYVKEEITMSKYQEKKEQIENIQAWDKTADDILQELYERSGNSTRLWVESYGGLGCVVLVSHGATLNAIADGKGIGGTIYKAHFNFSNQCDKLEAFKQALLWLLDHSDIKKDEKEEKIKELRKQIEEIQNQIIDMEKLRIG